jgi:HK97 family phage major capsid protein
MPYCDSYPVEGSSLTFTANAETSRVDGSRFGGIRGYWVGEATQMTASAPKVRQLKLEPHTLAVLAYMTDKLLQNNMMALDRLLVEAATAEIVFKVNDAIINGTGVGQPVGILNGAGIASVAAETGQAATTIVTENIDKMWARLLPSARANAVWLINVDCEPQLAALNRAVGAAGALVYSPPGGISAAPYATLKGRPVLAIEQCQTLGTTGDIWLAGLNYYALGLRGGVQADTSIHLRFDYNESAWRFLFHVDGQPWLAKAITPYKGSNTLAPFVKLDARS